MPKPVLKQLASGYDSVKHTLWWMQGGKCIYCEQRVGYEGHAVEHFRPKGKAARDGREDIGYWWLTWTWRNLYFACGPCNSQKGDRFPITGAGLESGRDAPGDERALIPDPGDDAAPDPIDLIVFQPAIRDIWVPNPRDGDPYGPAAALIDALGLDRHGLLTLYRQHVRRAIEPALGDLPDRAGPPAHRRTSFGRSGWP